MITTPCIVSQTANKHIATTMNKTIIQLREGWQRVVYHLFLKVHKWSKITEQTKVLIENKQWSTNKLIIGHTSSIQYHQDSISKTITHNITITIIIQDMTTKDLVPFQKKNLKWGEKRKIKWLNKITICGNPWYSKQCHTQMRFIKLMVNHSVI